MKLNFMHIFADLGFDADYPIYIYYWIKEGNHAITYTLVSMHANTFKNQKRCNLGKTPSKPRYALKGVTRHKGCPNYIKDQNQHMKGDTNWNQTKLTHDR